MVHGIGKWWAQCCKKRERGWRIRTAGAASGEFAPSTALYALSKRTCAPSLEHVPTLDISRDDCHVVHLPCAIVMRDFDTLSGIEMLISLRVGAAGKGT